MNKFVTIFLLTLVGGCTSRHLDGHDSYREDSSYRDDAYIAYTPPYHPCNDAGTATDFFNCGFCGNICPADITDRCIAGTCVCNVFPCDFNTQDCRFGVCVDADMSGPSCEFDGSCNAGYVCIRNHCTISIFGPEVCDGVDNDQDGITDGTASGPLSRWCYDNMTTGKIMLNLPCRLGVQICVAGQWADCAGAVSPIPETGALSCNSRDDDCDGCVDGVHVNPADPTSACTYPTVDGFDIVYAIDISGSMGASIAAVKSATDMFSSRFGADPTFRFGIALFPSHFRDTTTQLYVPLSDFATFRTMLLSVSSSGGSGEPSWDVVRELGDGTMAIGWRRNTIRIIIMFSDETGQSYSTPRTNEVSMCAALTHGEVLAVVERTTFFDDFDACATLFELTSDAATMAANLDTIISDPCTSH